MSKPIDLDKFRSITQNSSGYKGSTKKTVVDANGSNQVEHFDGRVDAEVRPKAVVMKATKQGDN